MMNGHTIFCDDIREEIGGKISLMGIYGAKLIVHGDFPAVLPKFCIAVSIICEPDPSKIDNLKLYIEVPGNEDPILETELKIKDDAEEFLKSNKDIISDGKIRINPMLVLAPFQIEQPGFIRVRAKTEKGQILKLASLKIEPALVDIA